MALAKEYSVSVKYGCGHHLGLEVTTLEELERAVYEATGRQCFECCGPGVIRCLECGADLDTWRVPVTCSRCGMVPPAA